MTKIIPIRDQVIVKRDVNPSISAAGLHVPDTVNQEKLPTGTVLAVGPGAYHPRTGERMPPEVKPGDHVAFTWYNAKEFEFENEKLIIMDHAAVCAIWPS